VSRLEWRTSPTGEELLVVGEEVWGLALGEPLVLPDGRLSRPVVHTVRPVSEVWPSPGQGEHTLGVPRRASPHKGAPLQKAGSRSQAAPHTTSNFGTRRGRPGKALPPEAKSLLGSLAAEGLPVREIVAVLGERGVTVSRMTVARRLRQRALQEES
jgi:hypothetical protein